MNLRQFLMPAISLWLWQRITIKITFQEINTPKKRCPVQKQAQVSPIPVARGPNPAWSIRMLHQCHRLIKLVTLLIPCQPELSKTQRQLGAWILSRMLCQDLRHQFVAVAPALSAALPHYVLPYQIVSTLTCPPLNFQLQETRYIHIFISIEIFLQEIIALMIFFYNGFMCNCKFACVAWRFCLKFSLEWFTGLCTLSIFSQYYHIPINY